MEDAIESPVSTIFLLHADIFNLYPTVNKVKRSGKNVFIHFDMLEGIGRDNRAIDYIYQQVRPHGIISTKTAILNTQWEKACLQFKEYF